MTTTPRTRRGPRPGGIFTLLALLLLLFTVISIFSYFSSASTLARALGQTAKAWEREEKNSSFLLSLAQKGQVTLTGAGKEISFSASPESASLAIRNEGMDVSFVSSGEKLTGHGASLQGGDGTGARVGAFSAFSDSALGENRGGSWDLVRAYLALTDPDRNSDLFCENLQEIWQEIEAPLTRKKSSVEEKISATEYTFTLKKNELSRLLSAVSARGAEEDFRDSVAAHVGVLLALGGQNFTSAQREQVTWFCQGKGERFAQLREDFSREESVIALSFFVKGGKVIGLTLDAAFGQETWKADVFLGTDPFSAGTSRARWERSVGEDALCLSIEQEVVEEMGAYMRQVNFEYKNTREGLFPLSQEAKSGLFRYSWGKEKGDLGLRIRTGEREVFLRGQMEKFRAGKEACVSILRMEEGGKNTLSDPLTLTLSRRPADVTFPPSEKTLFQEIKIPGEEGEE